MNYINKIEGIAHIHKLEIIHLSNGLDMKVQMISLLLKDCRNFQL